MTGFFRNFPQLRAGLGPHESTGIDSIPPYFGHDLAVCGPKPSGGKPDGRLRQAAALEKPDDAIDLVDRPVLAGEAGNRTLFRQLNMRQTPFC